MNRVNDLNSNRELTDVHLCPLCKKQVVRAETRLAETKAIDNETEAGVIIYCRTYQAIGISYLHSDGTMCDKDLYELVRI